MAKSWSFFFHRFLLEQLLILFQLTIGFRWNTFLLQSFFLCFHLGVAYLPKPNSSKHLVESKYCLPFTTLTKLGKDSVGKNIGFQLQYFVLRFLFGSSCIHAKAKFQERRSGKQVTFRASLSFFLTKTKLNFRSLFWQLYLCSTLFSPKIRFSLSSCYFFGCLNSAKTSRKTKLAFCYNVASFERRLNDSSLQIFVNIKTVDIALVGWNDMFALSSCKLFKWLKSESKEKCRGKCSKK